MEAETGVSCGSSPALSFIIACLATAYA